MNLEIYPPDHKSNEEEKPFFVEFIRHDGEIGRERWRLFKKNFLFSKEQWEEWKSKSEDSFVLAIMNREVHPWNLADGDVNPHENSICMNKKDFLKFMVDSMNDRYSKLYTKK